MEKPNYYDFISFPNQEERDKIRQEFFDFNSLRLCQEDIVSQEKKIYSFSELAERETISRKIIFFNNNIIYLDMSGLQFAHYYNLFVAESDKQKKLYYDLLFKQAYRNMCIEIMTFEEKIKNFLRFVYHFGLQDTKSNRKFLKKLKKKLLQTEYGKIFWEALDSYWNRSGIKKIKANRNNEIHNSTNLLTLLDHECDSNNKTYFEKIKSALITVLKLKNSFQVFLIKVYPDMKNISML